MTEDNGLPKGKKFCECGLCGELISSGKTTHGKPRRFKLGHNMVGTKGTALGKFGDKSPAWKGGRRLDKRGYVRIYCPTHPRASRGCVFEHDLVMESFLGRYLTRDEVVHHINGIKADNRIENLELMTRADHTVHHNRSPHNKPQRKDLTFRSILEWRQRMRWLFQ